MSWTLLFLAGLLEIGWAIGMKVSGFDLRSPLTYLTVALMIVSFTFLTLALRTLPVGTAYAVWTGIGAVGTAVIGMIYLGESRDWVRMTSIGLVVLGIIGLKLKAD